MTRPHLPETVEDGRGICYRFAVMKLILLGDIHGNLPALEKCVAEARREGYDRIFHSGDLVGYGPFPDEVIQFLRSAGIGGVRGNWDEAVAWGGDDAGPIHGNERLMEAARLSFPWTRSVVNPISRNILGNLPFEIRFGEGGISFSLVHANPLDNTTYILEDADELSFREYAKAAGVDILLFGHAHRYYHRQVKAHHFICVGSVGMPLEKDPRTGYTVIYTGNIGKGVDVNFRRFEYETARTARRFRETGIPDPFESLLSRTA
jgi:putative phosphoesterase